MLKKTSLKRKSYLKNNSSKKTSLKRTPLKKNPSKLKRSYIKVTKKKVPYRRSIVFPNPFKCAICGAIEGVNVKQLQKHEIFFGIANRDKSIEDKMIAPLCDKCHLNSEKAVHKNADTDLKLKQQAQIVWEKTYGTREDFIKRYGRSWFA